MMKEKQFYVDQPTWLIEALSTKRETQAERLKRLKKTADATGKRFIHVYREISADLPHFLFLVHLPSIPLSRRLMLWLVC